MEKEIRKVYLFMYMIAATIGTSSTAYLSKISPFPFLIHGIYWGLISELVFTILGILLGMWLLKFGRRKVLIFSDLLLVIAGIIIIYGEDYLSYIGSTLLSTCYCLNFMIILIICKEIPLFCSDGIPIVLFYAFQWFGLLLYNLASEIAQEYFFDYYQLVMLLFGYPPCILRIILLIAVFRQEPPSYSLQQHAEDEALIFFADIYKHSKGISEELAKLRESVDARKYIGAGELRTYIQKLTFFTVLVVLFGCYILGYNSNVCFPLLKGMDYLRSPFYERIFMIALTISICLSSLFVNKILEKSLILIGSILVSLFSAGLCGFYLSNYYIEEDYTMTIWTIGLLYTISMCVLVVIPSLKLAMGCLPNKILLVIAGMILLIQQTIVYIITAGNPEYQKLILVWVHVTMFGMSIISLFFVIRYFISLKNHEKTENESMVLNSTSDDASNTTN